MNNVMLAAHGVGKNYGSVVALRSVDLRVLGGERHALLGANGAGKSTFVKVLTGVTSAGSGKIELNGTALELRSPSAAHRVGIASVFQDSSLVPDLTVPHNLLLTRTDPKRFAAAMERLGVPRPDSSDKVSDLPLPLLRMIDLARALAHRPKLLVLDEITAALPSDLAGRVFSVMREHSAAGGSVLFISHRLEEVVSECDTCTVFRDGYTVDSFRPSDGGRNRIVRSMLGELDTLVHEAERRTPRPPVGAPRLAAVKISSAAQLEDVDIAVHPGEVLGVVALEGQGQDELFECLSGARPTTSGEIRIEGEVRRFSRPASAIANGVVLVPGDRAEALLPHQSVGENVMLPLRARRPGPFSTRVDAKALQSVVRRLSIDLRAAKQVRRLSGGNQQKVTIARWLVTGFGTLLLFDPTRGIDIGAKHQIYDLIRELAESGVAVVMYTSELEEVELVCDRVVVLHAGRVVKVLPASASQEEILQAAHGLASEVA
jgi:ribose transport system ATP-binding protein